MNLLLVEPSEVVGGRVVVGGRRARHIHRVLGATAGDAVRVGVVGLGVGAATVVSADPGRVELELGEVGRAPRPPPVELAVALPRPKVASRVLRDAASAGVRRLDFVNAWRVDKSYFDSQRLAEGAIRDELWLGCEQGAHPHIPDVETHRLFMPFLRERLRPRAAGRRLFAFHPEAPSTLAASTQLGIDEPALALIGPEGGWIAREIEALEAMGALPVALDLPVLRTEAAVVAALAQIALLRRRSSSAAGA